MRARHSHLNTAINLSLILLVGCNGRNATNQDHSVPSLPSTPIRTTLVVDTSAWVESAGQSDRTRVFDFRGSALYEEDRFNDIQIIWGAERWHGTTALFVFDNSVLAWRELEGTLPFRQLVICQLECTAVLRRLISQAPRFAPRSAVDEEGSARVFAFGAFGFGARLVQYSPEYHFAALRNRDFFRASHLSHHDNALYLAAKYWPRSIDRPPDSLQNGTHPIVTYDSLLSVDLEGERRWAINSPASSAVTAFDGSAFWILDVTGPRRIVRVDTSGLEIQAFLAPVEYRVISWVNGSLWYATYGPVVRVFEINVDSSVAAGMIVQRQRFTAPTYTVQAMTSMVDRLILAYGGSIHILDFDGTEVQSIPSPVALIDGMAWDGESLWVLHHGPPLAQTDATLLTRFTLE